MLRLLIFSLNVLLFSLHVYAQSNLVSFPPVEEAIQLMDEAMNDSDLPSLVAIAINKKGERIEYTYGPAVWTEDEPVTSRHIFRIASMTKLITSIAALQLVEQDLIGLDDDLSDLMPEMARVPILENGQIVQPGNPITLRHLLTHTSGFGYPVTDEALANFDRTNWEHPYLPRRFESGTKFLYGISTDLVGMIVEKVSGKNLEDYFRENITGPLGMDRTWFNVPDDLKPWTVSRGRRGDDGQQVLQESPNRIPANKVTFYSGGGGLFSSPADYTRLLECLLNYGELEGVRILKKETIRAMIANQIGNIKMDIEKAYFDPGFCCNFRGLIKESSKWGLAWLIDMEDKPYGRKAGTVLWGGVNNTYFYIDFQSGVAASIYSQHLPFNHPATTSLFERFSEIIYSDL